MDWVLSTLVLAGNHLIGRKSKIGWWILCINSLAWVFYALAILDPPQYGLVPSAVINFFICAYALKKWSSDG